MTSSLQPRFIVRRASATPPIALIRVHPCVRYIPHPRVQAGFKPLINPPTHIFFVAASVVAFGAWGKDVAQEGSTLAQQLCEIDYG
jgi:hypothetical protein